MLVLEIKYLNSINKISIYFKIYEENETLKGKLNELNKENSRVINYQEFV